MVTEETVKCQMLYEIQGNVYLNSDVKAVLDEVQIKEEGKNRVRFSGIKGHPPPPTTKLAIFFAGGYEAQRYVAWTLLMSKTSWQDIVSIKTFMAPTLTEM